MAAPDGAAFLFGKSSKDLLTQTESLNNGAVAINVVYIEILQELAATTYQLGERTSSNKVLVVLLQVLGEVLDTIGEQGNLALSRTRVGRALTILAKNLLLLCGVEIHSF